MRLRRSAPSFLLLTALSVGVLSPARAAEDPSASSAASSDPAAGRSSGQGSDQVSRDVLPEDGDAVDADPETVEDAVGQTREEAAQAAAGGLSVEASRKEAKESLAEVKDLFGPMSRAEAREKVSSGESRDATLALRDLSLRMSSLPAASRGSAYEDFQRPWTVEGPTSAPQCSSTICVHWLSQVDANAKGVPTWATTLEYAKSVLSTVSYVAANYTAAGYRSPRADGSFGGDGRTDIYLRDVGAEGKYGYCTVDVDSTGHFVFHESVPGRSSDLPAFCVLDNDYDKRQFRTPRTPLQDLQVTAAHEYFHAVQFAYDYLEDRWFMEATATWAEDQVYDDINDNVQYLSRSQLRFPGLSLDTYNGAGGFLHYGDWLFFEFLTERLPARQGPLLPVLVKRMWDYADSVHGRDYYSIQSVAAALAEKHVDFRKMFAKYAAANRHPATAYAEGRANHYPSVRPRRTVRLKPGHKTASGSYRVNHLASATVRFVPKKLPRKRTRLTLSVNMADKKTGSVAVALVYFKTGRITTKLVRLSKKGNGRVRVPFSTRRVSRVELVLVNANRAYKNCSNNVAGYSCGGVSRKDRVTEKFSAKVK